MISCYVAGPYSPTSEMSVEQNIENARNVASELRKAGMVAVVPHLESLGCEEALDYEGWMNHSFGLQDLCQCIVMVNGWDHSKGAIQEYGRARDNGQKVFFSCDDGYVEEIKEFFGR